MKVDIALNAAVDAWSKAFKTEDRNRIELIVAVCGVIGFVVLLCLIVKQICHQRRKSLRASLGPRAFAHELPISETQSLSVDFSPTQDINMCMIEFD